MGNKIIPFFCAVGFLLFAVIINPVKLYPVEVKRIDIQQFEDFQEGEFDGASLDSKGRLFIGPRIKTLVGPGKEYYLALDTAPNGDIYIGTGHKACVYKIKSPSAITANPASVDKPEEIFCSDDALDVYAIAVKPGGEIFAATSPEGKIYKITPGSKDKKSTEFFDPDEKFIWDLKLSSSGDIYCAVGNSGGIYKIDSTGNGTKIFASEDTHIMAIYITRGDSLLAGSGDRGILYRIDNRKVKVIYDSPFDEIRGICEDKDGNIYFSATKGLSSPETIKDSPDSSLASKKKTDEKEETKVEEKSILYCLNNNGIVEPIWSSRTEYIYTLYYEEKTNSLLIGTGNSGRLYRVQKDGSFSILYESDSAQIYNISRTNNGYIFITDNTASVASIEDTLNTRGTYYSDVFDLRIQSKVGRVYWESQTTPQTDVQLFVRSGNSNVPDKTWTEWSAPFTDSENSSANISDCRYFQVKITLNSKNASETPYLNRFQAYYIQSNLTPQVKKVEVKKGVTRPVIVEISDSSTPKPDTPPREQPASKLLTVTWQAEDPNKDKLKYTVFLKKTEAQNWVSIKEDIQETKYELNPELYQEGKYVAKVSADDSLSNPPSMAKSSEKISSPFIIDSTPPVVSNFVLGANRMIFNVQDQTSIVSRVFYSFDTKLWYPIFPTDTINDSRSESFDVDLKNLQSRKYVFIKVYDEFDNCRVFQQEI